MDTPIYRTFSSYLKETYGEKVYKLPINLPVSCPNRMNNQTGCAFCAGAGTGFEALPSSLSVTEQLARTKEKISKKYNAYKYIAYFQNYTNTFMPLDLFAQVMEEGASFEGVVCISISTRPDCVSDAYLKCLKTIAKTYQVDIVIELGLQTANYHTLESVQRGHGLAEYIDAVLRIKQYGFKVGTHVILNLPGDTIKDVTETAKILSVLDTDFVKAHSLYIAKNTRLSNAYENGTISVCSKEEYLKRVEIFLAYLSPSIVVERLFSRIPEEDSVFCNWHTSWWKLQEELLSEMKEKHIVQGQRYHYRNGAALSVLEV